MTKELMNELPKIVAIDFDGTLVEDRFPAIGEPISAMFKLCKELKKAGVKLILWTSRDNDSEAKNLDSAVKFCAEQGLTFDAVNRNIPEVINLFHNDTRKVYADLYLDDKAVPPWQDPSYWSRCVGLTWNFVSKRFTDGT